MSRKNRRRYHHPATKAITEDQSLKTENENAEQRFDALKNFYTILTIKSSWASFEFCGTNSTPSEVTLSRLVSGALSLLTKKESPI